MSYKTIGSRSWADRLYVLFLGIVFLFVLNTQMFWGLDGLLMVVTILSGRCLYKKITLFKHSHYSFSKKAIEITTSKKKTYKIPLADIKKITPVTYSRLRHTFTYNHQGLGRTVNYSTSSTNLLAIDTSDNITILISPRTIKDWVKEVFPFKK